MSGLLKIDNENENDHMAIKDGKIIIIIKIAKIN